MEGFRNAVEGSSYSFVKILTEAPLVIVDGSAYFRSTFPGGDYLMRTTMRAVAFDCFGGPEVLKVVEVATPQAGPNEVLLQVAYAALNPIDWRIRKGQFKDLLPYEFPITPGFDVSGTIVAQGCEVKGFGIGTRCFAYSRKPSLHAGTYSEYTTIDASSLVEVPRRLTLAEAASIPLVSLTAKQALFDTAKLQEGQTVLIHGGAGGVGGMAIQLAKTRGAKVISTASRRNHLYVRELGADMVIDYQEDPFARLIKSFHPHGIDAVLDTVGGLVLKESYSVVKPRGQLISIVESPDTLRSKELGIYSHFVEVTPSGKDLGEIAALFQAGQLRPLALTIFPMENARAAHERSETGRQRGKIVLRVFGE